MKRLLIAAIALTALGGCATYDYAGGSGPGGDHRGSPTYRYTYPDGYWGGYYGGARAMAITAMAAMGMATRLTTTTAPTT